MTLVSRPPLDTTPKITSPRSKYQPLAMSDESVYDMAAHNFTAEEIANRFKVTRQTLLTLHGDAFTAGKDDAMMPPRILLRRIIGSFAALSDQDLNNKDVPVERVLKAIEIHARKYEGYGQTVEVKTTETKPLAPADVKFTPLTKENKDESWSRE